MLLNTLHFGAKRKVKRYKIRGELVQNAVKNAAKRKMESINIHSNGINKTFYHHQNHGRKGSNRG